MLAVRAARQLCLTARALSTSPSIQPPQAGAPLGQQRIMDEAVRRASAKQRRGRWLSKYSGSIALGVSTFVAGSALKRRREYEEAESMLKATALKYERERDNAVQQLERVRSILDNSATDAIITMDGKRPRRSASVSERSEQLKAWVGSAFEESQKASCDAKPSDPSMI